MLCLGTVFNVRGSLIAGRAAQAPSSHAATGCRLPSNAGVRMIIVIDLRRLLLQVRPVAGLMHPRDFLNGLAFRCAADTCSVHHSADIQFVSILEASLVGAVGRVSSLADS